MKLVRAILLIIATAGITGCKGLLVVSSGSDKDEAEAYLPLLSDGCGLPSQCPVGAVCNVSEGAPVNRSYEAYLPSTYDPDVPVPLVLAFHGWSLTQDDQQNMSNMNATAEAHNFIAIYPRSPTGDRSWNAGDACCGTARANNIDDVGYVRGLVDRIASVVCIDLRKVYATGFSNGGFLSYRLACEASDVFAAVAPVSGAMNVQSANCNPGRAVPILHLHGSADNSVRPAGWPGPANGAVAPDNFPPFSHISTQAAIDGWVTRNNCGAVPSQTFNSGGVVCNTWASCDEGAQVTYCSLSNMGHCWPGDPNSPCIGGNGAGTVGTPFPGFNGSEAIADFFEQFSLP